MKGIILAGGHGTRLEPLTHITNKHLLPIYDKPMIEYPLATLVKAGITDILIVSGREHAGHFINYLGSGKDRGLSFTFKVQEEAGGIAEALGLAKDFVNGEKFVVILGDNIFEDDFSDRVAVFESDQVDCMLFIKQVDDPSRFGVLEMKDDKVVRIVEKPKEFISEYAVVGLYMYTAEAFDVIKNLKPSGRGELEITDLNNWYVTNKNTLADHVDGFWSDAGTFPSLFKSSEWAEKQLTKDQ